MTEELSDIDPIDAVDLDMVAHVEELTTDSRYIQIDDILSQGDRPFIINVNGESFVISERASQLLARTIYDVIEGETQP